MYKLTLTIEEAPGGQIVVNCGGDEAVNKTATEAENLYGGMTNLLVANVIKNGYSEFAKAMEGSKLEIVEGQGEQIMPTIDAVRARCGLKKD